MSTSSLRVRPGWSLPLLAFALPPLFSLVACGDDGTSPEPHTPDIHILAGADVTDTIDARLIQALRVVVRDPAGEVVPNTVVQFSTTAATAADGSTHNSVFVRRLDETTSTSAVFDTTTADGEAVANVRLGHVAGPAAVVITAPREGLVDTARYTVTPGGAVYVVLPVSDTAVQVDQSLDLAARAEDRYHNPRSDAVTFEVVGDALSVANAAVSASVPTRGAVIGRLAGSSRPPDTTWVSVVPKATILAARGAQLGLSGLDGSALVMIPHPLEVGDEPAWYPGGAAVLSTLGSFAQPYSLYRVELGGAVQQLIGEEAGIGRIHAPVASPDGAWIYMTANNCNYNAVLYRFPPSNPQARERISPSLNDHIRECFELVNHAPSVSPDGSRLTYENQTGNKQGYSVRIIDVATHEITEIAAGGQRPRWSPVAERIAYWLDDQIWVIASDGTGAHRVSPLGRQYMAGVSWSPDGAWLIGRFLPRESWLGTTIALLHVESGLEIPLAWTTGHSLGLPMWRPGT